ncbi:MAG: glycosyltransferase family 9 protein [Thermodesulfobacteriota bacterium]
MHPDVMRWIDRWVGAPLCFLFTLWRRLKNMLGLTGRPEGRIKKILFIELAEVGAFVVAYPALRRAASNYPEAELYFLTFSRGPEIIRLMGAIDPERLIIIRTDRIGLFFLDTLKAVLHLRRLRLDAAVNLEVYARFSTILAYLSGAGRRVGFHRFHEEGNYLGDLFTHKVVYNPHRHAAQAYVALVEALAEDPGPEPLVKKNLDDISLELPRLPSLEELRGQVKKSLKELYPGLEDKHRLVLLNPNASDMVAARRWPDAHFQQLALGLLEDPDILVVLTGAPDERAKTENLRQALGSERVLNMAGRTTLAQLLELYHLGRLLVTNDSGPAHFAALTEIPVLVLFGPETPDLFGPLGLKVEPIYLRLACSPCVSPHNQKQSPCRDNRCLKDIKPELVLTRAREILSGQDR